MYLQSNGSFNSKGWNDNGEAPGLYLVVGVTLTNLLLQTQKKR